MPQISADTPLPGEVPAYITGINGTINDGLVMVPATPPSRITLVPGALPRGSVLGVIAGSGLYALCDRTQNDGRQTPAAVLSSVADPRTGRFAMAYGTGTFNSAYLLWHSSWTLADVGAALRTAGMPVFNGPIV